MTAISFGAFGHVEVPECHTRQAAVQCAQSRVGYIEPHPAFEKLEIIKIVEQSHLPARRTLEQLGIARRTFCRWYDRYLDDGPEALEDRLSAPSRVWNRVPSEIHDQIIELALEQRRTLAA